MQKLRIFAIVTALVACSPLVALAQSVTGAWELTVTLPQGANTLNVTLKQTDDTVVGTLSGPFGSAPMKGTVSGADVTLSAELDRNGQVLSLTFKGKLEGDVFNGNVDIAAMGEAPFTGKRVKTEPED